MIYCITILINLSNYDHFEFPGVVPRSFVGALIIAIMSFPFHLISTMFRLPKIISQYISRITLGVITWYAFLIFKKGVNNNFGSRVGQLLSLIIATQFHLPFYMSRSIPNTYALIGCFCSFGYWLLDKPLQALIIIAPFVLILRCDLLVLVILWTIQLLMSREVKLNQICIP